MAYNEDLADRIRGTLLKHDGIEERKMFGGVAFLRGGSMFCGVVKDELMVRVGPDRHEQALSDPHARTMDFTGKPMRGYVFVSQEGLRSEASLSGWVKQGIDFVSTMPQKAKAKAKPKAKKK